jgi:hypothetical protein
MTLPELLALVVRQLESTGIDYMIGGSVASSIYGEPRTTRDIDIVIEVGSESLRSLFATFDRSAVYIDDPLPHQHVASGQMFNVLDIVGGWKVDLVIKKARPFSITEFDRRRHLDVLGVEAMVASPEDVLLTKLEWSLLSRSSRQLDDARGIVAVQRDSLDLAYLRRWGAELGVADLLDSILV